MSKRSFLVPVGVLSLSLLTGAVRADPLGPVAKHLSKGLSRLKTKRIAVLPFRYHNGDISSGSNYVTEHLTTLMVQRGGAQVVERELLDKALNEIRLGMTGMVDPATAQKLGKVLGVPAIVTGTLIDFEEKLTEVNARVIETETGAILAAETVQIPRTWDDLPHRDTSHLPSASAPAADRDEGYQLVMSKAIPNSPGPGRRYAAPPMETGSTGAPMEASALADAHPSEDVLTLTDADLVPVYRRGQTDPERILNDFMGDHQAPAETDLRIARRIYHRNPDPRVRARALFAMGNLLERTGRPAQAARVYSQVLNEFPDNPALQAQARQRLGPPQH
jgi:TolB-like protein